MNQFQYQPNQFLLGELKKAQKTEIRVSIFRILNKLIIESDLRNRIKNYFYDPTIFMLRERSLRIYLFRFIEIKINLKDGVITLTTVQSRDEKMFASYNNLYELLAIHKELANLTNEFLKNITDDQVEAEKVIGTTHLEQHRDFFQDCLAIDQNSLFKLDVAFGATMYLPSYGINLVTERRKDTKKVFGDLQRFENAPPFCPVYTNNYNERNPERIKKVFGEHLLRKMFSADSDDWFDVRIKIYDIETTKDIAEELVVAVKFFGDHRTACFRTINNAFFVFDQRKNQGRRFDSIDKVNDFLKENKLSNHTLV